MKNRIISIALSFIMVFTTLGVFPATSYAAYSSQIDSFIYDSYEIPAYDGDAYEIVNENDPEFSLTELVTESYENYSELDELGRCGEAQACLAQDRMPADGEERGDISDVFPTGWVQASYSIVPNSWLYNRCHLIGWQLSAENANVQNIITGTRSFNVDGMLPFENKVADYINDTGNHVLYRVTPVFQGDDLLAKGVLIEAESVEDNTIEFCVFCYNVQDGITIDYSNGNNCLESDFINKSIEDCNVTLSTTKVSYNGSSQKPAVTVKDGDTVLTVDKDYTLTYSNNTKVGTAKVVITGVGNYSGSVTSKFSIVKTSVKNLKYTGISNKTYTGKQIKPSITVKQGSKTLVKNKDYTVTYGTNKKTGKGYVTVKGKGNYIDSKKVYFYIVPKKPAIKSSTVKKSSISLKWSNVTGESGYQVAYKKSGNSTYKTYHTTKTSKTISKLKSGTKYNVKVRAYKTVDGVKKYGSWSSVKAYKTKGKAKASTTKNTSKTVYITKTGTKYHLNKNCRGLSNANSITATSLTNAKNQGYTLCGYED